MKSFKTFSEAKADTSASDDAVKRFVEKGGKIQKVKPNKGKTTWIWTSPHRRGKTTAGTVRRMGEEVDLSEVSSELLARYKAKAGQQASHADTMAFKTADQKKARALLDLAHKRYKGIIKATGKQFDNDMRKEEVVLGEEAKHNEVHVSDAGSGKYKVHAVGKKFADQIKVGEHLNDTELDDFSEAGGKVKMIKKKKD